MDRQSSLVIVPESQRTEPPLGKPMVTFVFSSVFAERPQTFSITLNEHYALQLLNSLNEGRCIINTRKVLQWSNLIKNSTISICISIPSLSETLGSIQPLDPCAFIRLGPMQLLSDHGWPPYRIVFPLTENWNGRDPGTYNTYFLAEAVFWSPFRYIEYLPSPLHVLEFLCIVWGWISRQLAE